MVNNLAVFQNFNSRFPATGPDSKQNVVSAYKRLKKQLGVKSLDSLGNKTFNIFSEAIRKGDITKEDTQTICQALDRINRNVEVIKKSETGFFSRVFSWLPFFKPTSPEVIQSNLQHAKTRLQTEALETEQKNTQKKAKQEFEDAVSLLPAEVRENVSSAALQKTNYNYMTAKKVVIEEFTRTFPAKLERFAVDFKAGRTLDKDGKMFFDRPSFATDAYVIYNTFLRGRDSYEKLFNLYYALGKYVSKESESKHGVETQIELLTACLCSWDSQRINSFLDQIAKMNYEDILINRSDVENKNDLGQKRQQTLISVRMIINMINEYKPAEVKA